MKPLGIPVRNLLAALGLMFVVGAYADYPERPIKVIVPTEAGGAVDLPLRALAPALVKALGQPVVIENRPGAGSLIGVQAVKKAAPDGYTLLVTGTGSLTISPQMRPTGFALEDFVVIGMLSSSDLLLLAGPHTSYRTIQELIASARAHPGAINFASNGLGSSTHLVGEVLQRKIGTTFTHVPFKGNPPSIAALLSKQSDIMLSSSSVVLALIESGQLRPLATTGAVRSEALPGIPTLRESGIDLAYETKIALFAPIHTPKAVIEKLRSAFQSSIRDEDFKSTLKKAKLIPMSLSPDEAAATIREESDGWRELFRDPAFRRAVAAE